MILKAENLSKRYFRQSGPANHFYAVREASLELNGGEVVVLMGRSGSGKTTLLHMLAGLLTPTEGRVWLAGQALYELKDEALSRIRNALLGVVPQGRSAVDALTVRENVRLPRTLYGDAVNPEAADRWLEALGIVHLADAWPAELSGGELRRMAIARALAANPQVVLADEPTGDLDDVNTERTLQILRDAAKLDGRAVLLVSHDRETLKVADRVYRMDGGQLTEDDEQCYHQPLG